jgi:hypothetical protein
MTGDLPHVPRTWHPTPGPWAVVAGLAGEQARRNGLVVVDADDRVVADCANPALPLGEQRANCRAVAALPDLLDALNAAEDLIGDMPRNPDADRVYKLIAMALGRTRHGGRS